MVAVAKLGGKVEKGDFKNDDDFARRFRWEKKKRRASAQSTGEQWETLKRGCGF